MFRSPSIACQIWGLSWKQPCPRISAGTTALSSPQHTSYHLLPDWELSPGWLLSIPSLSVHALYPLTVQLLHDTACMSS